MEYYYFLWNHDDVIIHLIKVDVHFVNIASGAIFQNVLREEVGKGNIIVLMRDPNGVHTAFSGGIPTNLTDKELDDLEWEHRTWGKE